MTAIDGCCWMSYIGSSPGTGSCCALSTGAGLLQAGGPHNAETLSETTSGVAPASTLAGKAPSSTSCTPLTACTCPLCLRMRSPWCSRQPWEWTGSPSFAGCNMLPPGKLTLPIAGPQGRCVPFTWYAWRCPHLLLCAAVQPETPGAGRPLEGCPVKPLLCLSHLLRCTDRAQL